MGEGRELQVERISLKGSKAGAPANDESRKWLVRSTKRMRVLPGDSRKAIDTF